MALGPESVTWDSAEGLGEFCRLGKSQELGDICNLSVINNLSVHSGTHVDAPSHFVEAAFRSGKGVEALDLNVLNGPVIVTDVPHEDNITDAVMEALAIPAGTRRIIFKTLNTHRGLMTQKAFDSGYTALTAEGARWLVNHHASVSLVGIDALSIAVYEDLTTPHQILLSQGIIPVEGLVLEHVAPGLYNLNCLPLSIRGSDGAPCRCILQP
eukprot:jgi/Botrbrau1/7005/Bobra.0165s0034.2